MPSGSVSSCAACAPAHACAISPTTTHGEGPALLNRGAQQLGTPTIELPVPPIELMSIGVGAEGAFGLDLNALLIVGSPIGPGYDGARFSLRHGLVFPKGAGTSSPRGAGATPKSTALKTGVRRWQ